MFLSSICSKILRLSEKDGFFRSLLKIMFCQYLRQISISCIFEITEKKSFLSISRTMSTVWGRARFFEIILKNRFFAYINISGKITFFFSSLSKSRFCPYLLNYQHFEEIDVFWDNFEKSVFCSYLRKYQHFDEKLLFFIVFFICPKMSMFWKKITLIWNKFE